MTGRRAILVVCAILGLGGAATIMADEPKWKQHTINGRSEFEAAGVFDVDNDGKLDIVSGDTWYQAPDWKPYHVRDVTRVGTYYNDFSTLPLDVNGDGHTDFVTCSYFGKSVGWVENPGKFAAPWSYHEVAVPGNIEAAWMVDLSGDGVPDMLPNTVNMVVWYEVVKQRDGKGVDLKEHNLGAAAAGHGVGSGDVNGDGRTDLLTPKGWFEAPLDPAHDHMGLASRLAAWCDRHPDSGPRRRWRWPFRRCLWHGTRLRPVRLRQSKGPTAIGSGPSIRSTIRLPRSTLSSGRISTATAKLMSW